MEENTKRGNCTDPTLLDIVEEVSNQLNGTKIPALYRIPAEIWEILLLEHVKPGNDIYVAYNSWSRWKSILEPTKKEWMFIQIFPFLLKYLSKKDVLRCRQVNKRWCHGVDALLESLPSINPADDGNKNLPSFFCLKIHRQEEILEESVNHPRNPIIGRSIGIDYNPRAHDLEHFDERLARSCKIGTKVLEQFGKYIYSLQISCHYYRSIDFLVDFIELFTLYDLTKLRNLTIHLFGKAVTDEFQNTAFSDPQLQLCLENLTEEQKSHFPKNLETLSFGCTVSRVNLLKLKQIIITLFAGNLKCLSMKHDVFILPVNVKFVHLSDLTLNLFRNESLKSLAVLVAPIRKLSLTIHDKNPKTGILLFKCINRFRDTINSLEIISHLENKCCEQSLIPFSIKNGLDLPNLKSFEFCGQIPSFNFIAGLRSLQYLCLKLRFDYKLCRIEEETLDIRRCMKDLNPQEFRMRRPKFYESNIWRDFRQLRVFTLEVTGGEFKIQKKWNYWRNFAK